MAFLGRNSVITVGPNQPRFRERTVKPYLKDSQYQALLKTVLLNPEDDLPRLVLADLIEELGDKDRADFIRVQVELGKLYARNSETEIVWADDPEYRRLKLLEGGLWGTPSHRCELLGLPEGVLVTKEQSNFQERWGQEEQWSALMLVSRGFVSQVRCTALTWVGRHCPRCSGEGCSVYSVAANGPCESVTRLGPELVRSNPVEKVVLEDRVPGFSSGLERPEMVPEVLYQLMRGEERVAPLEFLTEEDAHAALSGAALRWAVRESLLTQAAKFLFDNWGQRS